MTRATTARWIFATVVVLLAVVAGRRILSRNVPPVSAPAPAPPSSIRLMAEPRPGFLYGRVTTPDGVVYEGRLRWGGSQEAFWGDFFNGVRRENRWGDYLSPEQRPRERYPIEIFGFQILERKRPVALGRQLLVRFGEIARIEARGREVRLTLKDGAVIDLDRLESSDFDDGVRVWDAEKGIVDLDSLRVRRIELLPTPPLASVPSRLHGTVRTRHGDFTGFVQWDREKGVGSDELAGQTPGGELRLRFDSIRSIARQSSDGSRVTLRDSREIALSRSRNRGINVDDPRYGRVLVSWEAFERVDFHPGGSGPAYGDFPPGRPLTGSVTTRAGRRLAGRLVYDLDESQTIDTLDVSCRGVDYTLPFGLIASIVRPARVILQNGEELQLESTGDLREGNLGMLIFIDGRQRPEYVPWTEIETVDLDRPLNLENAPQTC